MKPKVVVAVLASVNLLAGMGLGVALDRYALSPERGPGFERHRGRGRHKGRRSSPEERMQRRMQHLTEELGLDAAQAEKIQAVFEARDPKVKAVFADVRPRLEALETETHEQLSAILRPDQQLKLEALRKRFDRRGPPWGGRGRGPRGPRGPRGDDGHRPPGHGEGGGPKPPPHGEGGQ